MIATAKRDEGLTTGLIFVDIRATGSDVSSDGLIELAAVRAGVGDESGTFHRLADPGVSVPAHVTAMTGITAEDVFAAAGVEKVLAEFVKFVGNGILVVFDAERVGGFVKRGRAAAMANVIVDVQELARILMPTLEAHDLATVAAACGAAFDASKPRRAMDDAKTLAAIYRGVMAELRKVKLPALQAINQLLQPTDWPMKSIFGAAEDAAVRDFTDVARKDITELLNDHSELFRELRQRRGDEEDGDDDSVRVCDLDEDDVKEFFADDGTLSQSLPTYEARDEQVTMARTVCQAYNAAKHVVIEAGTGTGKSLAYLVPSVLWAVRNRQPVVVSTNTKNLQEQLFRKDIPLLRKALDESFSAAMIKGRGNYLCVRKFAYMLEEAERELSDGERLAMAALITWAVATDSGDISENSAFMRSRWPGLWERLTSTGTECFGRGCAHFRRCFLMRARATSMMADVVIANHSVVFSEMGTVSPVLPNYHRIVFDEAHNIENVATDHLGAKVSHWRFRTLLDRLYRSGRTRASSGLLNNIQYRLAHGRRLDDKDRAISGDIDRCVETVEIVRQAAGDFLGSLERAFGKQKSEKQRFDAATRDVSAWTEILDAKKKVIASMNGLTGLVKRICEALEKLGEADRDFRYRADFVRELTSRSESCSELSEDIERVCAGNDENTVYWIEQESSEYERRFAIAAAPIDISQIMNDFFYDRKDSIVMCSATMTVNGQFDFIRERLGLTLVDEDRLMQCDLGSPFDYAKQTLLCVPTFLPEPTPGMGDFEHELGEFLVELFTATHGRGMALFTSYGVLNTVYPAVRDGLSRSGISTLGQGFDGERDQITAIFRRVVRSVLLGTQSFWEGVDIPGETLSCLLIARLPFAVFTDPVFEARAEAIERQGRNAFMAYSVPSAVIKLRQGFGRLIRHRNDRGVIIITDKRVVTRRYGQQFLGSLPATHRVFKDREGLVRTVAKFLE